ncbi:RNA polymerase sigma factor [Chondrinema litorale]|uniref:RNA polymerase sigma factor n=1 Tax=Chondrinema litorale TaxID=2994555 RepID=UPI002542899C|nr:RNA polymerase sigma-70 factor [Chondrinema litorale]UZR98824.1 RNA polymerase sigma-70 factor [Chondrinema litorale]
MGYHKVNSENEITLVQDLKAGNETAFQKLFHKYYHKIFFYALSYLKIKEDAEEIVHDTFVQIWNTKNGLDDQKSFEGYVRTISRNLIYNQIKKKSYHQLYLDYIKSKKEEASCNTEEQINFAELKQLTNEAFENLPPRRKEIYRLSRIEGLTHQEIAKTLGITVNTVKDQMSKALTDIRKYLTKSAHVPHGLLFLFLIKFFKNFF